MKLGYIRVSTLSQDYYRQQAQLHDAGVDDAHIFEEKVSGTKRACSRPEFEKMLGELKPDDECVFESMSRMARSMQDLIDTTNLLVKKYKVKVKFLKENITVGGSDGDNAMNALIFNIMGSFAQFERDLISDRTKQGIKARKLLDKNFKIGRPREIKPNVRDEIVALREKGRSYGEISKEMRMSKSTVYSVLKDYCVA